MPFAPVTTKELAKKCFINWNEKDYAADFMTMTYDVTDEFKEKCPAAVHIDGTARPQIIRKENYEKMHSIITHYYNTRRGLALINTSFNNHEEPIVCDLKDAIDSLNKNNVDVLVIENYNSSKLLDPECTPYLTHYNNMLKEYRNKPIKILEIGVKEGDSLKIWKDYLHPESKIYGIEKNPTPLEFFKQENTEIFYGSQTDIPFLNSVISKIGKVDVIIDDGGHTNNQLKTTFNYLFEYGLQDNGLYIMEDLGT